MSCGPCTLPSCYGQSCVCYRDIPKFDKDKPFKGCSCSECQQDYYYREEYGDYEEFPEYKEALESGKAYAEYSSHFFYDTPWGRQAANRIDAERWRQQKLKGSPFLPPDFSKFFAEFQKRMGRS